MKILFLIVFLSGLSFLAVEAAVPQANESTAQTTPAEEEDFGEDEELNDPLEPLNRTIYFFNSILDAFITKPLAIAYRLGLPEEIRNGIGNAFTNIGAPITFVNHLLQGQPSRAGTTLARFGINTTLGIGGLFDPARDMGFHTLETNFNETMGVWGVNTGPYLMLPIIGPSSFRGSFGLGADYFTQPLNYAFRPENHNLWIGLTMTGVEIVHQRNLVLEAIDDLEATSLDMYASLRSIYFQKQTYRLTKLKKVDEAKTNDEILDSPTEREIFG
ncbi:MlaA family lipoprotein [Candidatus Paracaedibacter symbiosus]|uniref:MlaA family lipoprotein n=1 Tax=Candidatus Paracaedibacter symbiosus TaxID=244582 RepID=UPI00068F0B0B|nr:VacJ family lipoprotein [Candidatus Paracaedibacter symbiosus]